MKLALDPGRRFVLTSAPVGWELVVDGKSVHYCRTPDEALRFLAETLMFESPVDGLTSVLDALAGIAKVITGARSLIDTVESDAVVVRALRAARGHEGKEALKAASLAIAECSEAEFKTRLNRESVVTRARAILEAWHDDDGRSRQEGGGRAAEERAAGA